MAEKKGTARKKNEVTHMQIKKLVVFTGISLLTVLGILSAKPPENEKSRWKNVRIISKNTSEDEMEQIMESFNRQLGVVCIYCHALNQKDDPHKSNFESDEKPAKNKARKMLSMTLFLNRKYFGTDINNRLAGMKKIWCSTCHRGLLKPVINQ